MSELLNSEATQIARVLQSQSAITPDDIKVYLEWLKVIAEIIQQCRERRQGRRAQSWQAIRKQSQDDRQVRRIHARVQRKLGPTARAYGGIQTTRYLLGRYKDHPGAELENLVASAMES